MLPHDSEWAFNFLFQRNPQPMAIYDTQGVRCFAVNDAKVACCGYSAEELLSQPQHFLFYPEDHDRLKTVVRDALPTQFTYNLWRIRRKDGALVWVENTSCALEYQGQPARLVISKDVTDQVLAQESMRREQQFSDAVVNTVDTLIVVLDRQGHIIRFNQACEKITGYSFAEVRNRLFWEILITPEEAPTFAAMFADIRAEQVPHRRENVWIAKDGRHELIAWCNVVMCDADGAVQYVVATGLPLTERRAAEEALRKAERDYRSIFENAMEGIFQTTLEGRYLRVNPALAHIYGYADPAEMIASFQDIERQLYVLPERRAEFIRQMHEAEAVSNFEAQVYRKDGSVIWIVEQARLVRGTDGEPLYYEGTVQDITPRKALEAERERLLAEALERADHDPLTGLLNHRAFHKRYAEETARAEREGTAMAVAVLDLDNFKFFNDSYGHAVGDDVLRQVAESLRRSSRIYDVLARFGGDEFALLMPGTTREAATLLAERLVAELDTLGYRPPGAATAIPLSLTLGFAVYPEDSTTEESVLEVADSRLLHRKTGGTDNEAIVNFRSLLTGEFEGFSMLDALVTAVDTKDRYTRRHSEDVMRYAVEIAQEMGLEEAHQRTIQMAALLHDVGKIGVPDRILRKPGHLTENEFEAIRQHPLMGAAIVGAVPGFEATLDAVRHHHERWDGRGYPFGLATAGIPLTARIMAVADAYSAMTMDRPYRKGLSPSDAQAVLVAGAGNQWDPKCVSAFQCVLNQRVSQQCAFNPSESALGLLGQEADRDKTTHTVDHPEVRSTVQSLAA